MRLILRAAAACLTVGVAAAGCGGGSPGGTGAPSTPSRTLAGSVVLQLGASSAGAVARRPRFLSPSAKSVSISVTGSSSPIVADVSASSPSCTSSGSARTCTIPVSAPAGNDSFTVALYDGANATGKQLGAGSATQTIGAAVSFTVNVLVGGIVAAAPALATPSPAALTAGAATAIAVPYTVTDADANVIAGALDAPLSVTLSTNDTFWFTAPPAGSGATVSADQATLTIPNAALLSSLPIAYGGGPTTATVVMKTTSTLSGSTPYSAQLTVTPQCSPGPSPTPFPSGTNSPTGNWGFPSAGTGSATLGTCGGTVKVGPYAGLSGGVVALTPRNADGSLASAVQFTLQIATGNGDITPDPSGSPFPLYSPQSAVVLYGKAFASRQVYLAGVLPYITAQAFPGASCGVADYSVDVGNGTTGPLAWRVRATGIAPSNGTGPGTVRLGSQSRGSGEIDSTPSYFAFVCQ